MKHLFCVLFLFGSFAIAKADNQLSCVSRQLNDSISNQIVADEDENVSYVLFDGSAHDFAISWKKDKRRKYNTHWSGFGVGVLGYDNSKVPNSSLIQNRSYSVSVNVMSYGLHVKNTNLMLVTGLGFDWHRYHFDDNVRLDRVDNISSFIPAPQNINYKSSKLLAYYATIPLMIECQASRKLHIAAGAVAFINYYTKSQVKYYIDDRKHIDDMKRDLNLRAIDVKLKFQIGISDFNLYGYYSPQSMFEKNNGPNLKPYNIGVMLGF